MTDDAPGNAYLASQRRDYTRRTLLEEHIQDTDPYDLASHWLQEATDAKLVDATALTFATVDDQGWPDARIVLLKGLSAEGWDFYTNYNSAKVKQLENPPHMAAALMYWSAFERQVRVRGPVTRLDRSTSEAYFRSRPRPSQLGAWASEQSAPIGSRETLDAAYSKQEERFPEGSEVPTPPFWGGLRLCPLSFEFWQGRSNRLHDRFYVERDANGRWQWTRLAP